MVNCEVVSYIVSKCSSSAGHSASHSILAVAGSSCDLFVFLAVYKRSLDLHTFLKDRVAVMCVPVWSSSNREVVERGPVELGQ